MNEKYHNIYISSINKIGNSTNYNYNIYLSNYDIKILPDEIAYINITGFQTLNSFYNINDNSKSFTVKITTPANTNFTYNYELDTGNYDVYNFMNSVNNICSSHFTMNYNERKNKWNYISNQGTGYSVFIKPNIYNNKYFGFPADVFTQILGATNGIGTYSSIVNMNNFSLIIIKLIGLVEPIKAIDNFNSTINKGDICCIINRQDTNVGSLISFTDINNSFMKQISNPEINQLTCNFTNEFNQVLTDLDDWLITMKIIIRKKL